MTISVPLPKPEGYPKEFNTIGDHIRAWRLDNKLLQVDVAEILSVCEDTVTGWEMRNTVPSIGQIPGIVRMIGYLPVRIDVSTLGGQIKKYRYEHGLTPDEFGELIPAHPSTVLAWEKGEHVPPRKTQRKIENVLKKEQPQPYLS
jgi:DNA-binding transcriptional regulator YiaG